MRCVALVFGFKLVLFVVVVLFGSLAFGACVAVVAALRVSPGGGYTSGETEGGSGLNIPKI